MVFGNMNFFQAGSLFPSISGSALCLAGERGIKSMEIDNIKSRIISVLEKREKISISLLSEELDAPPRKIIEAIRILEKEGILREA